MLRLVVQDRVQQRIVDCDLAVVVDITQLTKFVHELIDARTRCANHVCEHFLIDRYGDGVGLVSELGVCQGQQSSRQPLLT